MIYIESIKLKIYILIMLTLRTAYKAGQIKRVRMGRPGTSLKIGLLGMANIGKSSTFNILSNLNVPA
jgi:hypothetical protein